MNLLARHPQLTAVVLPADLSDETELARVLAKVSHRVGPVDVLVNNAGVGDSALFDRTDWRRTRAVLVTNVLAPA